MKAQPHTLRRLTVLAAVLATAAIAVPLGQANTDGAILTQASEKAALLELSKVNPGKGTDGAILSDVAQAFNANPGRGADGPLLSTAARGAQLRELATIHPGRGADGPLLTEASLLYALQQINPGRGTDGRLLSAAASHGSIAASSSNGFDWSDAAAGFGLAAAAALLAAAAVTLRRRGTLAQSH